MTYVLAYNPTDSPVVIDTAGRVLGGREWGPVDTTDAAAKEAFDAERLLQPEAPAKGSSGPAADATKAAAELTKRAESFGTADKEQLLATARAAGLLGADDTPHKPELVALLTRSAVPTSGLAAKES